jgi:hypothetical protein
MTIITVLSYEHLVFVKHTGLQNLYGAGTTKPVL